MKNRTVSILLVCGLALPIGACRKPPPEEPIFLAYHGSFFDREGRELTNLSRETIDEFLERRNAELAKGTPEPPLSRAPPAATYIDGCRQEDVPIPPPWGDAAWQHLGDLPRDRNFAGQTGDTTQVWAYNDPGGKGMCFALPRIDRTGIRALGIICQSKRTGKACFWDNISKTTGRKIKGAATAGMKVEDMQDPTQLKENCTACHRGPNAFIVHVGTKLEVAPPFVSDPDTRYEPFSGNPPRAGWSNPPAPPWPRDTQCVQCHEFPELTKEYCETVLKKSIGVTMPPGGPPPPPLVPPPGKWDPDFVDDVTDLSAKCRALGVTLGVP